MRRHKLDTLKWDFFNSKAKVTCLKKKKKVIVNRMLLKLKHPFQGMRAITGAKFVCYPPETVNMLPDGNK